jgi:hypothetical protein
LLAEELLQHKDVIEPRLTLMIDEMNIKAQTRYVPSEDKIYGFVDFGNDDQISIHADIPSDEQQRALAKNALFYMVNGINFKLKMPIAYALIDKLSGPRKAELTKQMIRIIFTHGKGIVKVVVFDGDPAHFTMVEHLGGSFKILDITAGKVKTSFRIEGLDWDIFLMLDLNHMLKLIRNHLESKESINISRNFTQVFSKPQLKELLGRFYNDSIMQMLENDSAAERNITWKSLQKLHDYQEDAGIRLDNKITKHHINFRSKIMSVRLCAQTLHDKTGDSLLQCEFDLNLRDFKGSVYTALTFKIIHRIFSIFNSMGDDLDRWKLPLTTDNVLETLDFLDSVERFIVSLRLSNGKSVLHSKVHTGFAGILVAIDVLRNLSSEFIETGKWDEIKMYSTSQDHLEIFFGFVRMRLGCNDNPDAYILECVYKSILGLKAMHVTKKGNCEMQANNSELTSKKAVVKIANIGFEVKQDWKLQKLSQNKKAGRTRKANKIVQITAEDSEDFTRKAISFYAISVQKELKLNIDCRECLLNFDKDYSEVHLDIVTICRKTEFVINLFINRMKEKFSKQKISVEVLEMLDDDAMSEICDDHSHGSEDILDNYRFKMIKRIINSYITRRAVDKFKRMSDNFHGDIIRQVNKKLTLFNNQ